MLDGHGPGDQLPELSPELPDPSQVVGHFLNTLVGDLRDVDQTSLPPPMATNAPKSTIRVTLHCRRGLLRFLQ